MGEDEGPKCVWEALDVLGVSRIGHGCSAVEDKELLKRLARDRILVECCVTSNFQTGAVKAGEHHPIYTFLEYGVPVAICTDNPTISDTSQNQENEILAERLPLNDLVEIHGQAVHYSFIGDGAGAPKDLS